MTIKKPPGTIIEESDVFQPAEGKIICLSKMRCKDYYSLLNSQPRIMQFAQNKIFSISFWRPEVASLSGSFLENLAKPKVDNLIKQLFHSRLLDMRLVIANSALGYLPSHIQRALME